jgi:hypothetical protein
MASIRELPYVQALYRKNIYAKELLEQLFQEPYASNNERINSISKAIKFNTQLIKECYERATDTE